MLNRDGPSVVGVAKIPAMGAEGIPARLICATAQKTAY